MCDDAKCDKKKTIMKHHSRDYEENTFPDI